MAYYWSIQAPITSGKNDFFWIFNNLYRHLVIKEPIRFKQLSDVSTKLGLLLIATLWLQGWHKYLFQSSTIPKVKLSSSFFKEKLKGVQSSVLELEKNFPTLSLDKLFNQVYDENWPKKKVKIKLWMLVTFVSAGFRS